MSAPHPALLDLAADRPLPPVPASGIPLLLASAAEHRVDGLLWTRVLAGELQLEPATAAALAMADLRRQQHGLHLWRVLDDVVRRLRAIGVDAVAFKGVTAEARWYRRSGERPCNDLDLVLPPAAGRRGREIVRLLHPDHVLLDHVQELVQHGVLQSIDLDVDGAEVDLHTDLLKVEVPMRRPEAVFDAAVEVTGPGGACVRALSPEHSLVHFALHLNKDGFGRLLAYADIARIMATDDLDWDAVDRFAADEGLRVHVHSALHEVARALRLPPPPVRAPTGPRARLWQALWPEEHRLTGRASLVQRRHRQLAIPWTAEGRLGEAVAWWTRRRLLPPKALVDLYYADTDGPYLSRLITGRWRTTRHNRALARELEDGPRPASRAARYKTFPPKWAHIQVPVSSRAAAQSALALYAPCRNGGYALRDAAWVAVGSVGPRLLPGRATPLRAPVGAEQWQALLEVWRHEVGTFDALALHSRHQEHRTGFAVLLLSAGRAVAFVRVRNGSPARFTREKQVLDLCAAARPASFWHPEALAVGELDDWSYLAMTAFPRDRHVAGRLPIDDVLADIGTALAPLPRPDATPAHWLPMHGDLTPWNCRDLTTGRRALIDWEDAAWGPPGADDVLFRATEAALAGGAPGAGPAEAIAFWADRLAARPDREEEPVGRQTLDALRRMEPR